MKHFLLSLLFVSFISVAQAAGFEPDRELIYKTVGDMELELQIFQNQKARSLVMESIDLP